MLVQGAVREGDYVRAQYLHVKLASTLVGVGFLVLVAGFVAANFRHGWVGFMVPLLIVVLLGVVIPWQSKRTYRQYKALSEPVSMEVRADGLYFKREHGEGLVPWSHIVKWRRNKSLVLLYPARNIFFMVPGHFFPSESDFEAFKTVVQEHVGRAT